MSRCQQVGRPIVRSLGQCRISVTSQVSTIGVRQFSSTLNRKDEEGTESAKPAAPKLADEAWFQRMMDPNTTTMPWAEKKLIKQGTLPVGSRRRRAAIRTSTSIPFEQLPYQCFQEARKVLNSDREKKLAKIVEETAKIKRLEAADPDTLEGGEALKQQRLQTMRKYVEDLKILADVNDPLVKRRFEDGLGDMKKPIYRYLADRRWRSMDYKIISQRISQFHIVPDVLPKFDPTMDVKLFFRGFKIPPGEILDSRVTEIPPSLHMQVFDKGERLVSVLVVDYDVPNAETDEFGRRCHFLGANIPWDPTKKSLPLSRIGQSVGGDLAVPWLPPTSQKGAPYHRLGIFVLEQPEGTKLDAENLKTLYDGGNRDGFSVRAFQQKFRLTPVGFNMFRTVWDEGTAEVMTRHNIPGADIEYKRKTVKSLKPPRKARGWEAKRQKPKYKSLWKYTKRIA